jgi:hypothetical protein
MFAYSSIGPKSIFFAFGLATGFSTGLAYA